jgi:ribulose-phosphate 3-epimerase
MMCADFRVLPEQLQALQRGGISTAHLDFGDGRFVANFPLGLEVFSQLPPRETWARETHLMVDSPLRVLHLFAPHSDVVIVHVEAVDDPRAVIAALHDLGVCAGLALNPSTPAEAALPLLAEIDQLLVMTVEPGFAGSPFVPAVVDKLRVLRSEAEQVHPGLVIAADGAISKRTVPTLAAAGANHFVAGSSGLFCGDDLEVSAASLLECVESALRASEVNHASV